MKNNLLYLLAICPLTVFAQLDSLKGKIKILKETTVYADSLYLKKLTRQHEYNFGQYNLSNETIFDDFSDDLFRKTLITTEQQFNQQGQILSRSALFSTGFFYTTYYSYDDAGNPDQVKEIDQDGDYQMRKYHYIYKDTVPYIASEMFFYNISDVFTMQQYFYDRKYQLIEKRHLSSFGWNEKTNYKYDQQGRKITEINFNLERKLKTDTNSNIAFYIDSAIENQREDFVYNDNGKIRQIIKGCGPYLVKMACAKIFFEYDNQNRLIKKVFHWGDSLFSHREYQYNSDNTVRKIAWFFKDYPDPKSFVEYFYNNKEIVKAILTDQGKSAIFEFKYKLDSHNNWIEQRKFVDGELFYTRKREITYWD